MMGGILLLMETNNRGLNAIALPEYLVAENRSTQSGKSGRDI